MTTARAKAAANKRNPVARAIELVSFLADRDPARSWGVRELSASLSLPVSAIHRTLMTLEEQGWIERGDESGSYRLALNLFRMALALSGEIPLRRAALPAMHEITAACRETTVLGLFDYARLQMCFIAQVDTPYPFRFAVEHHRWAPIHAGASGLSILAFLEREVQEAVLARYGLPSVTNDTITDAAKLRQELETIRQRGYAISKGQRHPGTVGIAAPIIGHNGIVLGNISVLTPVERSSDHGGPDATAALVMKASETISAKFR